VNAEIGWGKGLGGKPFPVFKNFYGGGLGTVRVFRAELAGHGRPDRRLHRRARKRSTSTPSCTSRCRAPATTSTLRIFAFADAGNVWREDEPITRRRCARRPAGPELDLAGGPAEAELGPPIAKQRNDRIQRFQFQIGTAF
jgi:outer membrane protein insertion porin family